MICLGDYDFTYKMSTGEVRRFHVEIRLALVKQARAAFGVQFVVYAAIGTPNTA